VRKLTLVGVEVVLLFGQGVETHRVRVRMSKSKHFFLGEFGDEGEVGARMTVVN